MYLNHHDEGTFNIEVQGSNDGGQTYVAGFGEAIDPQTFPAVPATNSANIDGQIKVDRSSCPSRGNLYVVFVAPDSVAENLTGGALRSAYVGVSTDLKLGLPPCTFTDTKVFSGTAGAQNQGAANIFPALATDDFGFVYAVWSDNSNTFYSFSTDQGTTCSSPIHVSFGINGGHANVFPWIEADAEARTVEPLTTVAALRVVAEATVAPFTALPGRDNVVNERQRPCTSQYSFHGNNV